MAYGQSDCFEDAEALSLFCYACYGLAMNRSIGGEAAATPDFGINVIGHVSGNLGLGVLAPHLVTVLLARRCQIRLLDVDPKLGRGQHDQRFAEHTVGSVNELPFPVTLLVFPPDSIVAFLKDPMNRTLLSRHDGLNVAFMNWEQMVVPTEWSRVLAGLDVITAPSAFTRETFEHALPHVPVLSAKVPLRLPETVRPNRAQFGLRPHTIWFGTSFEPQSDPARKNPLAVLDAFERAFPGRRDVGLMIKLNNPNVTARTHPLIEDLRLRSRRDSRIVLIQDSLGYTDVLNLYASLDVFVSLHRSEGIGLGLMEAMSLGKPVIATGWSGNMSFMDRANACVVSYDLVPVRGGSNVYSEQFLGPQAVWAEPDVTNAAEWMRTLVDRPAIRAAIGQNAREAMVRYQEEAQRGLFVDELRSILQSEVAWGVGERRRGERLGRLERSIAEIDATGTASDRTLLRRLRSVAKTVGFRRGPFPFWRRPRRGQL